jgi:RsmE family RNA methyltransferase
VSWGTELSEAIDSRIDEGTRLALDNYEAAEALGSVRLASPVTIAIGPERGWSEAERMLLRTGGYHFVHLGERVLRVETACVAAIALVRAGLGSM